MTIEGEIPKKGIYMVLEPQAIRAMNIKTMSELVEGE